MRVDVLADPGLGEHAVGVEGVVRQFVVLGEVLTVERAAEERIPVYFYGTTPGILAQLKRSVALRFPKLIIAGAEPSKFRTLNGGEKNALAQRIRNSGAAITMVGLGCPQA